MSSLEKRLEPSSCAPAAPGPKHGMPGLAHGVGHTLHERGLGADHDQAAAGLTGKICNRRRILGVEGDVLAQLKRAAVARGDVERAAARGLGELGSQGVLATAATQQQDVDGVLGCAHASSSRARRRPTGRRADLAELLIPVANDRLLAVGAHGHEAHLGSPPGFPRRSRSPGRPGAAPRTCDTR